MSDYFFTNALGRSSLISGIAKWLLSVLAEQTDSSIDHESRAELGKWESPKIDHAKGRSKSERDTNGPI